MKQAILIAIVVLATLFAGWSIMAHAYAPVSGLPLFVMPGWKMLGAMVSILLSFGVPLIGGFLWFSSLRGDRQWYLLSGMALVIACFWVLVYFRMPVSLLWIGLLTELVSVLVSRFRAQSKVLNAVHCIVLAAGFIWSCSSYGACLGELHEEAGGQRSGYVVFEQWNSLGRVVFDNGNAAYVMTETDSGVGVKLFSVQELGNGLQKSKWLKKGHPPIWRISDVSP